MEIEQNIFFDEFNNKLVSLENSLIDVQSGNYSKEDINEIFRSIHTIKGTADLLGMFDIVTLTHKAEDVLQYVREDKLKIDDKLCELLFDLKNFISLLVTNISQGIFDDDSAEDLFIQFEKEFNSYLNDLKTPKVEYVEPKTLLIVEDSAMVRYMIKKIATDEGYNVLTADNTEDGWQKIQSHTIDLLFCDFSLPNDEYIELAETIRVDSKTKNLPIVMLLAKNNDYCGELGKKISAKAWLRKPVDAAKVKLVLEKILVKK